MSGIVAAVSFVLTALATPWMAKYASGKYIHKTDIPTACISTDAQVLYYSFSLGIEARTGLKIN